MRNIRNFMQIWRPERILALLVALCTMLGGASLAEEPNPWIEGGAADAVPVEGGAADAVPVEGGFTDGFADGTVQQDAAAELNS